MLLYHGTKESCLEDILLNGLRPRPPESEGNHAGALPELKSRDSMVYLSSSSPIQYAEMAAGNGRYLILEVDTDRLHRDSMLPDEDTIAHAVLSEEGVPYGAEYLRRFRDLLEHADPLEHRHRWKELLERGGSVAHHGTIPPAAFTRYVLIDRSAAPNFFKVYQAICQLAARVE